MSAQILKFTQPVKNSPHYFGGCPYCGDNAGYMNVGSNHWCVCDTHKTKWQIGSNLFSGWKNETEDEWKRNAYKLQSLGRTPFSGGRAHRRACFQPGQVVPIDSASLSKSLSARCARAHARGRHQ